MKKIAVYPGTFDPITKGHVDIIQRAEHLFDAIIIAVAVSERKNPLFTLERRVALIEKTFASSAKVSVEVLSGLTVDFAMQHGAQFILRGIRFASDVNYELQLEGMNKQMVSTIETVFLVAKPGLATISSTVVREIIEVGGDVSDFVPTTIAQAIRNAG